jgi:hypothetical protein
MYIYTIQRMVIREEKKFMGDKMAYLRKQKTLTPQEKEDYRRKKLVEVRKGTGPGRPIQRRKPSSVGYTPISSINAKREKEMARVLQAAADVKEGKKRQKKILKGINKSIEDTRFRAATQELNFEFQHQDVFSASEFIEDKFNR